MIPTWQLTSGAAHQPTSAVQKHAAEGYAVRLQALVVAGLLGMLILSPVQFITLPLNMSPVDIWNAVFLPLSWVYIIKTRSRVHLPYLGAFWLIMLGSFVGTFAASRPVDSLVAILKDVYLYVWFLTVVALLTGFEAHLMRRVLQVWLVVTALHGMLIIAQFVSPQVFQGTASFAARFGALDQWRPSGLYNNANGTGLFQLMGFVPLLLLRPSRGALAALSTVILVSILATGSLAATGGFLVGLAVALVVASRTGLDRLIKGLMQGALVAAVLGGLCLLVLSQSADLSARFASIFYDRAQGSAAGRFSLWERGLGLLSSQTPLWGIGPDSYRDVDLLQKPLHNDLLAFVVERGLIGAAGLVLLAGLAVYRAARLARLHSQSSDLSGWAGIVFLAALAAALVNAQFHQIFHDRSVWLVLATQEAILFKWLAGQALQWPLPSLNRASPLRPAAAEPPRA
jgi:O-antigen ligase